MQVKIGKVYLTGDGRKVEIIGLSEYHEFVGTSNDANGPLYFDTKGIPIDIMMGDTIPNSPWVLVKEVTP